MKIRPAFPDDAARLRDLLEENALTVDGLDYGLFTPPTLVGLVDGEIVGFVQAHLGAPYAVITELAIARAHHRKGYAVKLLEHMETVLRVSGVSAWVAYTGEKNPVAEQLERYGARSTGSGTAHVRVL